MKRQFTKSEIMTTYNLTEAQFELMRNAINASSNTFDNPNEVKAMLWGLAINQLYDGKSFAFVLDVMNATGKKP